MAPPPPRLPDELVEEILLRIPPHDPARLVRASVACKAWGRFVSSRGFRRRFRERHRSPPLMGALVNSRDEEGEDMVRFVPACSFRPPRADLRHWVAVDSRHGRVLLSYIYWWPPMFRFGKEFPVWDPVTHEHRRLPPLPMFPGKCSFNAAVLCAASGSCDHLDCHRGPFLFVFVGSDNVVYGDDMFSFVYSSETGAWSKATSASHPVSFSDYTHRVVVGNALYFGLSGTSMPMRILKYDLGTREVTLMHSPPVSDDLIVPTTAEGGGLGCVTVMGSRLCFWAADVGPDGQMRWVQSRIVEIETLIPAGHTMKTLHVVSFEDGGGVVYVGTNHGSFATDLKSGQFKEIEGASGQKKKIEGLNGVYDVFPFMRFYTPVL